MSRTDAQNGLDFYFNVLFIRFVRVSIVIFNAAFVSYSNYGMVMLAAVRVLTEQQPVEEEYGKFK